MSTSDMSCPLTKWQLQTSAYFLAAKQLLVKCCTRLKKMYSSPFHSIIVFSYCFWSFFPLSTTIPAHFSISFSFWVWISLSKVYKQTFALEEAHPSLHKFIFWWRRHRGWGWFYLKEGKRVNFMIQVYNWCDFCMLNQFAIILAIPFTS